MAHDFLPRRDAGFLNWSAAFCAKINASPGDYGLTTEQASDYAALHEHYATSYHAAKSPLTRGPRAVLIKNEARRAAERAARRLARQIQGMAAVTDQQRQALGLTVRKAEPSPVPRPSTPPRLVVKLLYGATVRVDLRDVDSPRRGKAAGIAGASVFSHVGAFPPAVLSQWTYEGDTTRPQMDITLPPTTPPGAKVWLTAYWYNPRAQGGPAADPVSTHIQCPLPMLGQNARAA
jgi:hypothetical protein